MKKVSFMRKRGLSVVVAGVLASCAMAAVAQSRPTDPAVASLGAVSISQSDVDRLLQSMSPAERMAVKGKRELMDNLLRQRLAGEALLAEARSKGWADRPEVKARVEAAVAELTQRIVTTSYLDSLVQLPPGFPSEADLSAAYEQGKPSFNLPAAYRIAQIYLAAPSADAAATAKVRQEAQQLAKQARTSDFAELARRRSDDPRTAVNGGEVGMLPLAQLLPEVRTPVSKLKVGEVSEALQSPEGFHIIKLLESQPARVATLEEMKPQLRAALVQQRQQQMVREHMASIAPASSVLINSAAVDAALQKLN